MKLNKAFMGLALAAMLGGFASCSSENDGPSLKEENQIKLNKPADIWAYTGNHFWYGEPTKASDLDTSAKTEDPTKWYPKDEVEVNLALQDNHEYDFTFDDKAPEHAGETVHIVEALLCSHTSIHVRTPQNVQVTIPVPQAYLCETDDMEIVLKHEKGLFLHAKEDVSFQVGETTVGLSVAYGEDGIVITTSGINEAALNYCLENYGDGITFEVWNYYNAPTYNATTGKWEDPESPVTRAELAKWLDQATVEFIGENKNTPDYYINGFGRDNVKFTEGNLAVGGTDFHVTPIVGEGQDEFEAPFEGPHYNGSEVNDIYVNTRLTPAVDNDGNEEEEEEEVTEPSESVNVY